MQFQKYHQNISKCVENLEMFMNNGNHNQLYAYANSMGKADLNFSGK